MDRRTSRTNPTGSIGFVRPVRTLPISLTGTHCALQCAHCGGHYLAGMTPIQDVDASAATSCLISGGCNANGAVPITSHLDKVSALRPGRLMNWHVGMVSTSDMERIAPLVDVISFDVVGDDATIQEVYGLPYSAAECFRTYDALRRRFLVVPHLTLGLRAGQFSGEYQALRLLKESPPPAFVILVLIPTVGTRYAHCAPPDQDEVVRFLQVARESLPETAIYLGCMRPGGYYRKRLDPLAVQAGVDKIVNPAPAAERMADYLGLQVHWEKECCVFCR